jgi:hypothetical protein
MLNHLTGTVTYVNLQEIIVGDKHIKIPDIVDPTEMVGQYWTRARPIHKWKGPFINQCLKIEFEKQLDRYTRAADVGSSSRALFPTSSRRSFTIRH